jgi:tRNA/tmRNA/rRNA uracil-C5-methylase (TrmA/RlmC/RlmD family)
MYGGGLRCVQVYGTCGGCQYQHLSVVGQRDWKRRHVTEVLAKMANLTNVAVSQTPALNFQPQLQLPVRWRAYALRSLVAKQVNPVLGTGEVFAYRSKLTPHYDKPVQVRWRTGEEHLTPTLRCSRRHCDIEPPMVVDAASVDDPTEPEALALTLTCRGPPWLDRQGEIRAIGFLKQSSRSLVDVPRCEIATPAINEHLATMREEVRQRVRQA